jgi:hypothetical protein
MLYHAVFEPGSGTHTQREGSFGRLAASCDTPTNVFFFLVKRICLTVGIVGFEIVK